MLIKQRIDKKINKTSWQMILVIFSLKFVQLQGKPPVSTLCMP